MGTSAIPDAAAKPNQTIQKWGSSPPRSHSLLTAACVNINAERRRKDDAKSKLSVKTPEVVPGLHSSMLRYSMLCPLSLGRRKSGPRRSLAPSPPPCDQKSKAVRSSEKHLATERPGCRPPADKTQPKP